MKAVYRFFCISLFLFLCLFPINLSAQRAKEPGVFNTMSIGVGVGTDGTELELAAPMGKHLILRASASMIPNITLKGSGKLDVEVQDVIGTYDFDFTGRVPRAQFGALLNIYPSSYRRFYLVAGAFWGGSKLLVVTGHSEELRNSMTDSFVPEIPVGNQMIHINREGNFSSDLLVNKVRGYVGIGGGRNVPRKRVSLSFELGAQFQGTPHYTVSDGQLEPLVLAGKDMYTKLFNNLLKFYPVMKLSLHFRLF